MVLLSFKQNIPSSKSALLAGLPAFERAMYETDFRAADAAYYSGRVAAKARDSTWDNWKRYVEPLGLDPFLEMVAYQTLVGVLSGFTTHLRTGTGFFGRGQRMQSSTVSGPISSIHWHLDCNGHRRQPNQSARVRQLCTPNPINV